MTRSTMWLSAQKRESPYSRAPNPESWKKLDSEKAAENNPAPTARTTARDCLTAASLQSPRPPEKRETATAQNKKTLPRRDPSAHPHWRDTRSFAVAAGPGTGRDATGAVAFASRLFLTPLFHLLFEPAR